MKNGNRRTIRLPVSLPIKARFGRTSHNLVTLNVSVDGAFVVTPEPPALGHLVHVTVILPKSDKPVKLQGMVMRIVTGDDARHLTTPAGMGIQYYGLGETAHRAWEDFFHTALEDHIQANGVPPAEALQSSAANQDHESEDEPTGKWLPQTDEALGGQISPTAAIQPPRQWLVPVLYRVCPPDADGLERFSSEALVSGGVMIRGTEAKTQGSPAVVAVVHPESGAEFHIPGEVQAGRQGQTHVPVRFLTVTERTKQEFAAFVKSAGRPPSAGAGDLGPADKEMVLFESADEAQWDVVLDHKGAVLVDGVLPLQSALDPFGGGGGRSRS